MGGNNIFLNSQDRNTFFVPLIMGKFLELNPLIIVISILVAASTLGFAGVILAPPLAASICVLIQELYINKINPITE